MFSLSTKVSFDHPEKHVFMKYKTQLRKQKTSDHTLIFLQYVWQEQ